eukprot:SAG31_NODE_8502_length_1440_cov_1.680835_1_plen_125_part_00
MVRTVLASGYGCTCTPVRAVPGRTCRSTLRTGGTIEYPVVCAKFTIQYGINFKNCTAVWPPGLPGDGQQLLRPTHNIDLDLRAHELRDKRREGDADKLEVTCGQCTTEIDRLHLASGGSVLVHR